MLVPAWLCAACVVSSPRVSDNFWKCQGCSREFLPADPGASRVNVQL